MSHSTSASRIPFSPPFFYGWVIVFIAALGLFFSGPGQTYSISVFIDSYIQEFGWSRSLVSTIYSVATLVAGFLLFIVGRYVDRYGQRRMTVTIALLLGLACLWNSFVMGPIMLFIGFFLLRLLGQGSMTLLPGTLVPQWFIKRRGRALSLMAVGGFVSSAALPPFNAWLIDTWGWSTAWQVWAGLLLFLFVPLAYFLIRNQPEDVGLLPDNEGPGPIAAGSSSNTSVAGSPTLVAAEAPVLALEENWTLQEAKRTRAFWLILLCAAIPAMVNTGLTFHFVSILGESGIPRTTAAFVLSIMALLAFPVTLVAGYINDRFKVHVVLALSFLGQFIAMLILFFTESVGTAIIFGVVRGIVGGFEAITLGVILPNYFGRKHLGSIRGASMTTMVIGSAFGPLPFGVAYDWFGGYAEIMIFMMLFPIIGMVAAYASPPPRKKTDKASHTCSSPGRRITGDQARKR